MTIKRSKSLDQDERLQEISRSVKGTFQTVEDMTQSFIREAIVQGIFPPGQRLNLDSIAAVLGVSRMPVRASLRQLESEGLVHIYPHRGATVSILQAKQIAEIYEIRILLEGYLTERAMPHLTDTELERLRKTVAEMERSKDLGTRLELRKNFYEYFYELADRPRALAEAKTLRAAVGRYLLLRRVDDHGEHPTFIHHLELRDTAGAKKWLKKHLTLVSRQLQHVVAQDDEVF